MNAAQVLDLLDEKVDLAEQVKTYGVEGVAGLILKSGGADVAERDLVAEIRSRYVGQA